jgi:hypothetical protein
MYDWKPRCFFLAGTTRGASTGSSSSVRDRWKMADSQADMVGI